MSFLREYQKKFRLTSLEHNGRLKQSRSSPESEGDPPLVSMSGKRAKSDLEIKRIDSNIKSKQNKMNVREHLAQLTRHELCAPTAAADSNNTHFFFVSALS